MDHIQLTLEPPSHLLHATASDSLHAMAIHWELSEPWMESQRQVIALNIEVVAIHLNAAQAASALQNIKGSPGKLFETTMSSCGRWGDMRCFKDVAYCLSKLNMHQYRWRDVYKNGR